jgi:hypothetical protein
MTIEWGRKVPDDASPARDPAGAPDAMGEIREMMLWPAVTLLGFLLLTAVVIGLGAQTTARYEREQRAERPPGTRHAAEPAAAVSA